MRFILTDKRGGIFSDFHPLKRTHKYAIGSFESVTVCLCVCIKGGREKKKLIFHEAGQHII